MNHRNTFVPLGLSCAVEEGKSAEEKSQQAAEGDGSKTRSQGQRKRVKPSCRVREKINSTVEKRRTGGLTNHRKAGI